MLTELPQDVTIQYDYVDNDKDPFQECDFGDIEDDHGTCCAGTIAMAKNNKQCGVGVAHLATITGMAICMYINRNVHQG